MVAPAPWLTLAVLFFAAPSVSAEPDEPRRIAIVHGHAGPHEQVALALEQALRHAHHQVRRFRHTGSGPGETTDCWRELQAFDPEVIATGGSDPTLDVLRRVPRTPVVFFMVPNVRDAPFAQDHFAARERVAGVSSDVDPDAQLAWARETCPDLKSLAIPASQRTARTVAALVAAGQRLNIRVAAVPADRDAFPRVIDKLNELNADGVLMIPDAQVYNSPNVQRLLLWGIRHKKPVWTFSDKVVKAGAYSGSAMDASRVATQVATLIRRVLHGEQPAAVGIQYAADPQHAVNLRTAEMLDLKTDAQRLPPHVRRFGDDR